MRQGLVVIAVVACVVLAGCTVSEFTSTADDDDDASDDEVEFEGEEVLEIHHLDVGQADATLLITPSNETVLVDTGDWRDDGEDVISYLEERGIERIDHLVATHGHADHVGGHAAVIEHFETERDGVGAAYDSGVPHTSATYENYLDAVDEYDVDLLLVEDGDELPLEDDSVTASVLNPPAEGDGDDIDENSVALAVDYDEFRYLTTGDAGSGPEERLVDERADEIDADVYQVGHHGSSTSSTPPFLDAVDPEIAVLSSAYDSQYGHPHDEVLEALADQGVETYWTGVHGDVVVTTDGTAIDVEPAESGPTDAGDLLEEKPSDDQARLGTPDIQTRTDRVITP